MTSCECEGLEELFTDEVARKKLEDYRRRGPAGVTKLLIDTLAQQGVRDASLLDIGGGIGAIQFEMLKRGVKRAHAVDGASAYIAAAVQEAKRQGVEDRVTHQHGDFVAIAPELSTADIVTLDKVICCFDDMPALVSASAALAGKFYAVTFPPDSWWMRLFSFLENNYNGLRGNKFRSFAHSNAKIKEIIRAEGFKEIFHKRTPLWHVFVFAR